MFNHFSSTALAKACGKWHRHTRHSGESRNPVRKHPARSTADYNLGSSLRWNDEVRIPCISTHLVYFENLT
jgi:hypothetical protein